MLYKVYIISSIKNDATISYKLTKKYEKIFSQKNNFNQPFCSGV